MSAVTRAVALAVAAAVTLPVTGCGAIGLLPGQGRDTTPTLTVEGTDGGELDALAARTVAEMYRFLDGKLPGGATLPELRLVSYDSTAPTGLELCGDTEATSTPNAFFCSLEPQSVAWDRGEFMPWLHETGGDLGVSVVIAHELGHGADHAQAPDAVLPTLVGEQRADCVAGAYTRWRSDNEGWAAQAVSAEGQDAVEPVAAAIDTMLSVADPLTMNGKVLPAAAMDHGVGVERMYAFLMGWERGATSCFSIGVPDTTERRDRVHVAADTRDAGAGSLDMDWTPEAIGKVLGTANTVLGIDVDRIAQVQFDRCIPDGRAAAICPSGRIFTNPVALDEFQALVAEHTENATGDGTGLVALVNVVANGWLRDRGANVEGDAAGLRAACVSGAVLQAMSEATDERLVIVLSAGDLDEALTEVLVNGNGASDADGNVPDSAVARVGAFLHGIYGVPGPGACVTEYADGGGR